MLVVACDPGTKHCAFAIYKNGKLLEAVKIKSTFEKIREFFENIADFDYVKRDGFTLVIEDQYLSLNVHTLKRLVEIRTTVITIAKMLGAEKCIVINPSKWQRTELGVKTSAKRDQRKRVSRLVASSIFHGEIKDNDIADAICIGDYYNRTQTLYAGG